MTSRNSHRSGISQRLYLNVKRLAKAKGLKMQDVEKAARLAIGYFARCNQNQNSTSIDTVYTLAKLFNVSIDDLISDAYEREGKDRHSKVRDHGRRFTGKRDLHQGRDHPDDHGKRE